MPQPVATRPLGKVAEYRTRVAPSFKHEV